MLRLLQFSAVGAIAGTVARVQGHLGDPELGWALAIIIAVAGQLALTKEK